MYIRKDIDSYDIECAERVLIDNGVDRDEAATVLQAIGYVLLDAELYPDNDEDYV